MTETVHVGTGSRKSKAPRWPFIVVLVVVVIVAAGFGAASRWYGVLFKQDEPLRPDPLPAVVVEVHDLRLQGKVKESNQKIDELLANPATSDADKYHLYILQGNARSNTRGQKPDFQGAVESYAKAYQIKETFEAASKLGGAWEGVGNKQKAIQFYRRALELIPADSPVRANEKRILQESIKALEGQP